MDALGDICFCEAIVDFGRYRYRGCVHRIFHRKTYRQQKNNKMTNLALRSEVEALVREVEKTHRYSMSRIYGLYNRVFGTNETPQSCASCLIRKVRELKSWLAKNSDNERVADRETPALQSARAKTEKKRLKKDK